MPQPLHAPSAIQGNERMIRPNGIRRRTSTLMQGLLIVSACLIAVLAGLASSQSNPLLVIPFALLPVVFGLVMLPTRWWIWALVVVSLLVVGPAVFFGKIDAARWVSPALCLGLILPLLFRLIGPADVPARYTPAFIWLLGVFITSVAFSTAINNPSLGEILNSPRYYLVTVPLLLLLMLGALPPGNFERLWQFLIVATLVQLPVTLVQHFVYAARGVRNASWDAVVGTFPGLSEGGGESGGLGIYLLTTCVIAAALWRRGLLATWYLLLLSAAAITSVAMAEVKAVVLLIPVALGLLYAREILRRPLVMAIAIGLGLATSAGIFLAYDRMFYSGSHSSFSASGPSSPMEGIGNQLNPDQFNRYIPPGRMASFVEWWQLNPGRGDVVHSLFGHGGAATQANRVGIGKLVPQFRYPLYQTATGMLLWETGILGHTLLALGMLAAALTSARLVRHPSVPNVHQALLHGVSVALVIYVLTLPYRPFILLTSPSQVMLALLLGFVAYWARQVSAKSPVGVATLPD